MKEYEILCVVSNITIAYFQYLLVSFSNFPYKSECPWLQHFKNFGRGILGAIVSFFSVLCGYHCQIANMVLCTGMISTNTPSAQGNNCYHKADVFQWLQHRAEPKCKIWGSALDDEARLNQWPRLFDGPFKNQPH